MKKSILFIAFLLLLSGCQTTSNILYHIGAGISDGSQNIGSGTHSNCTQLTSGSLTTTDCLYH